MGIDPNDAKIIRVSADFGDGGDSSGARKKRATTKKTQNGQ
jgi:hypothetical protein